jgi:CheY-like chemotaxis protein
MKKRVLVVDDHHVNRELIRCVLETRGIEVSEAVDGNDALEKLSRLRPDMILLDVQMPQLDGFGTIERIRRMPAFTAVPVVALTALAMPDDRERTLRAGFSAYMTKPVDFRELDMILNLYLAGPRYGE